ncbi:MAG TPA: hypothetical protein VJZ00_14485 [Thermoanaerobaculia bacterium]|nr:hypothetical protein [Thermoanaerobaculia bacterium]
MTFTERVRKLFLEPKRTYTLDEADAFFDMPGTRFDEERFEAERGPSVAWREIVLEMLTSHPLRMIEEALGADADRVLPPLLRTIEVTIRVPQCDWIVAGYMARMLGWKTDDVVADLLSGEGGRLLPKDLECDYPGLIAATSFPYDDEEDGVPE